MYCFHNSLFCPISQNKRNPVLTHNAAFTNRKIAGREGPNLLTTQK